MKNPARVPKIVLSQKEEIKNLESAAEEIGTQFKAKVAVIAEEKSKEPKAKQAMPGKPAILID